MPKTTIESISTTPVSVTHDPALQEIHRPLGGKPALPGSPAGREAQPNPKIAADFITPEVPRSN
jgi:hypothetical protein